MRNSNLFVVKGLVPAIISLFVVLCLSSCNKGAAVDESPDNRIGFSARGVAVQPLTKAEVLTSLSSFYVTATTGTAGEEAQAFLNERFALDGEDFVGQVFWPASNPSWRFYASNVPAEFRSTGCCVWADSGTDVVYALLDSPTYQKKNTLTFKHAFALLDEVRVVAAGSFSISGVDISFVPNVGGTFDIHTGYGHTDGTGWDDIVPGESVRIASAVGTNANTVFTVPGSYTVTASWTASLPGTDYSGDVFSGMGSEVTLVGGKRNILTITLGGSPAEITFIVTVLPWDEYDMGERPFPIES